MPSAQSFRLFRISRPGRMLVGLLLLLVGLGLMLIALRFDWGVAVTTFVPGLVLLVPASGLLTRNRLLVSQDEDERPILRQRLGLFRQRDHCLCLDAVALEIVPTAGLYAVVLHEGDQERPIATWVRRATAERLVRFLDEVHGAPLPRRSRDRARWDR